MSLKIFERAQRYVDKVMSVKDSHTEALDYIDNSSYKIFGKNYLTTSSSIRTRTRDSLFEIQMLMDLGSLAVSAPQNLRDSYHRIADDDYHPCVWVPRNVMVLQEFKEDLDFQLSTLMDDDLLLEYYSCCILYTRGYRGYIKRMISHNTLNAMKKHLDMLVATRGNY